MKRKKIIDFLELSLIFLAIFIYNFYFYTTHDHIIDFTHCFSISNGLKIYKDFNIVIGPVYPFFMSIFLSLFGKNLLVFDIVNSLIIVLIFYLIKRNNDNTLAGFIILIFHGILIAKYNTFTLLLFYIIYYLELSNHKYKDYLIGFILSITIFTKINGIFLIMPTIILHYKELNIILKRLIIFIITSIIIISIMYIYGIIPDFINYTLLGLLDFANSSSSAKKNGISSIVILLLITSIYIIHNYKNNKNIIYMLFYLSMAIPSLDYHHTMLAIFPTIIYFTDKLKANKNIKKISYLIAITFFLIINTYNYKNNPMSSIECKNKYCSGNKAINTCFNNVHKVNNELSKKYKDYKIYYFNYYSYFYKLDLKEDINKFDFIWEGNMGYKGEEKYIKEIETYCNNNKCLFIIDKKNIKHPEKDERISLKILKLVTKKYQYKEELLYQNTSIYTNDNILNDKH